MNTYACIDIGGTAIKYGILTEETHFISRDEMDTEAYKGGPSILKKTIDIIESLQNKSPISGICISTAGMVDIEKGEIFHSAPLIPDYTGTQFKKVLEERFHMPCEVENDVNCAGLAELHSGAAKDAKAALVLTVGTGIGGCILIDGKVFHGASGSACEVGYMHLAGSDFQTLGAASILTEKVSKRKNAPCSAWDGRKIFEEAKQGDSVCIEAINEMADILGKGIANICYVVNPSVVVLGGGIMAQEEYLKPRLQAALSRYLLESVAAHTSLRFAVHGNNAGMLGAFYHFMDRQKN